MEEDPRIWLEALRRSHRTLAALVGRLTPDQRDGPSYCTDWTVAQVLSHLGSGAEIFSGLLAAALPGGVAFGREDFAGVWARWDAKSPADQAADVVPADGRLIASLDALGPDLAEVHPRAMGRELSMAEFLAMRLGEHALHVWDLAATGDGDARLDPAAAALLVDRLPTLAKSLGRAPGAGAPPLRAIVATTDPDRTFVIQGNEDVTVTPVAKGEEAAAGAPDLTMAAEALVRLAYGRLDPDHTPTGVAETPVSAALLERLRDAFPGN